MSLKLFLNGYFLSAFPHHFLLALHPCNLLRLEDHAGLIKLSRGITKTRHSRYSFALHLVLTKKSELKLNDKDVFPQVCTDIF